MALPKLLARFLVLHVLGMSAVNKIVGNFCWGHPKVNTVFDGIYEVKDKQGIISSNTSREGKPHNIGMVDAVDAVAR